MMKPSEFASWTDKAKPGETIVYHHGDLAAECVNDEHLRALRRSVMLLSEKRKVCLTQKRNGADGKGIGLFDYRATRR